MADIGVDYKIIYHPDPISVQLALQLNGTKASVVLKNVPSVVVTATPHYSANILTDMVSTIGTPLANAVTASLSGLVGQLLQGRSFDVYTIPSMDVSVDGTSVHLEPAGLKLGNFNGMLMLTGDLNLK